MAKFEQVIKWLRQNKEVRSGEQILFNHDHKIYWYDLDRDFPTKTSAIKNDQQISILAPGWWEKNDWEIYQEELIYGCGHKGKPVILDSNELSVSAYLEWKDTVGFSGDKSMCWECWCKKDKINKDKELKTLKDFKAILKCLDERKLPAGEYINLEHLRQEAIKWFNEKGNTLYAGDWIEFFNITKEISE